MQLSRFLLPFSTVLSVYKCRQLLLLILQITEFLPIKHIPFEELDPHDIRMGWSLGNSGNIVGFFVSLQ